MAEARKYLEGLVGERAMPALALAGDAPWRPVGEEILYAFVSDSPGFVLTDSSGHILALVDGGGYSKAIAQGVTGGQKGALEERLASDGVGRFEGKVILPV